MSKKSRRRNKILLGAAALFGASKLEIEVSSGFSITKTDDDFYTFTVSTAPSITGSGGGGQTSSGPATLSN